MCKDLYEIVKTIRAKTEEAFAFGEGCVYPLLHHLEQTRLVRWAMIGCGVVFLHALLFHAGFTAPHGSEYGSFWIGHRLRWLSVPELMAWALPLLAFVLSYVHLRRAQGSIRSGYPE